VTASRWRFSHVREDGGLALIRFGGTRAARRDRVDPRRVAVLDRVADRVAARERDVGRAGDAAAEVESTGSVISLGEAGGSSASLPPTMEYSPGAPSRV
jgi:hypothetical protein